MIAADDHPNRRFMNDPRNRRVFDLRWQGATLLALAVEFGISKARVRQIDMKFDRGLRFSEGWLTEEGMRLKEETAERWRLRCERQYAYLDRNGT